MLLSLLLACVPTKPIEEEVCTPQTCEDLGAQCGEVEDGCGATLSCGGCEDPQLCNELGVCETPCTPMAAVFFDLGGTLVLERDDGLFEENTDARALLQALRDQGLPIGTITNVPPGWDRSDLEALLVDPSILDLFDVLLLSSEAESRPKPDPDIFLEALALLPAPPEPGLVAFVTEELGDIANAEPPTRGARAAGLIGVHLSDEAPSPLAEETVASSALLSIAGAPWVECVEAAGAP